MSDLLEIFFQSIRNVSPRYIRYKECQFHGLPEDNVGSGYNLHLERVFAYELYHQWSNNLPQDRGLMINAEISKRESVCFDGYLSKNGTKKQESDIIYPDLVLHKGQDDNTIHEIVCEIKRSSNHNWEAYAEDLRRLIKMTYLRENTENFVPYNYGVFLLCGDKDKDWNNIIKNVVWRIDEQMRDMVINNNKIFIVNAFVVGEKENAHVDFNKIDLCDLL